MGIDRTCEDDPLSGKENGPECQDIPAQKHPLDDSVRRDANGIWGGDVLPVMEWEAAEARVVLSERLRVAIGQPESVVRWAVVKHNLVMRTKPRDAEVLTDLNRHLARWQYAGKERSKAETWHILFQVEERWYAATLGRDSSGSLNIVTAFGSNSKRFLANHLKTMTDIVEGDE